MFPYGYEYMKKFLLYHLPAISYAGLIIALSSIPNLNQNRSFLFGYDKLIHFAEYAIFAILIFRSFSHISIKIQFKATIYLSFAFIAIFALFDELYQSRIPGRETDLYDILSDILGAALIVIVMAVRRRYKQVR